MYGGDGLARLDGRVVFAPFVLPGERILARAEQEKPGMVRARMLEVLEAAPDRVAAPCPVYGRCGGCHYQHAPYDYQLAAKRAILVEALRRLGKMEPPAEIAVVAAEPFGYRNRVQLHVEENRLGYREARSHRLCAVTECPVGSPRINQAIGALAGMQRDGRWPRFMRSLEVFTDEREVQINVLETDRPVARRFFDWCGTLIPGLVEGALDYRGEFRVSSNSFFQVNRLLIDRLVETAIEGAEGETATGSLCGRGSALDAAGAAFPRGDGGGIGRGGGARSAIQRVARGPGESARGLADGGGAPGAFGEGAGFRGAGSAAHGVGQGSRRAAGGVAAAADHDCGVRPGDAGTRSRGIGGGGLSRGADDDGGPVPADLPSGDRGAVEAGVGLLTITLSPDQELRLAELLGSGAYQNAEQVLDRALEMLLAQEERLANRDELAAAIELGFAEAERGELIDGGDVRSRMTARKKPWMAEKRSA